MIHWAGNFSCFFAIRWVQSNHTYTKQLIPKCFRSRKVNLNNKNDQKPMHRSHSLKHDKRKEQKKSWKKIHFTTSLNVNVFILKQCCMRCLLWIHLFFLFNIFFNFGFVFRFFLFIYYENYYISVGVRAR